MELNKIYNMDCVHGLRKMIPNNSIDLTITSPPYDKLRKYKGYQFDFEDTAKELYRVTKPGGIVVWIVGDSTINGSETGSSFKQALFFKEIGFKLYDTMIYAKKNPIPLNHRRYEQEFEFMFVFSKGKPKTFNPIKVPTKTAGNTRNRKTNVREYDNDGIRNRDEITVTKKEKIKGNIWYYPVGNNQSSKDEFGSKHPAIFPEQLAADHIISWSNEGDIILDPFMGSGTTAKMAIIHNRKYIGFEVSDKYVDLANQRIENIINELKEKDN